jgi:hypothetical protein
MNNSLNEKDNLAVAKIDELNKYKPKKDAKKFYNLFTLSMLDYICSFLNPNDKDKANFKEICNKLIEYNVIRPIGIDDQYRPFRFQLQKLLYAVINSKKSLMPEIKAIQDGNQSFNSSISKKKSFSIDNIFLSE